MGKMMRVSPSDDAKRFLREMLPVVLTGLAGVLVFHRATLLSGFDLVQADIGDSRLAVFLLEHWTQVLAGNAGWASPPMFYPVKGVLGYSDMMFGTGVLYTLFRTFGLGLFQATNATMVLLSLLSYLSAYWVLRRVLKATLLGSIVGAFFFAFAYPKFAQLGHLQLRFDFFQPLALAAIGPLLLEERAMCRRELATRTSIFAGLVCLAASTTFYNAWFFVFFLAWSTLVAVSYRAIRIRIVMRLREARRVLWIPILLGTVMLAPFFIVYLPPLRLGIERNWKDTIEYLPRLSSYFWLGPEHFLWGSLRFNSSDGIAHAIENHLGLGVAVTSVVFVGWAWAIRHFVRAIRGRNQSSAPGSDLLSAMLLSSLIVTAITVRWGSFYPWKAVYELVPGASVMFGVGRWVLTLTLPVSILIAVGAGWLQQRTQGRHALSRAILLAAGSFIAVEQVGRIPAVYSAAVATWYHEEVAHVIPASCEGFLLVPPVQSDNAPIAREDFDEAKYLAANPDVAQNWPGSAWDHYTQLGHREGRLLDLDAAAIRRFHNFHYHLSAMIAAAISGKPTVNGASGLGPAGYPVSNLYQQDIVQKLGAWMSGYPSRGACVISKEFSPYKLAAPGPRSRFLGITLMD